MDVDISSPQLLKGVQIALSYIYTVNVLIVAMIILVLRGCDGSGGGNLLGSSKHYWQDL
jgi:hypothetical protein